MEQEVYERFFPFLVGFIHLMIWLHGRTRNRGRIKFHSTPFMASVPSESSDKNTLDSRIMKLRDKLSREPQWILPSAESPASPPGLPGSLATHDKSRDWPPASIHGKLVAPSGIDDSPEDSTGGKAPHKKI